MDDIEQEIKKLKYKVKLLSSIVDYNQYPIEALMLSLDWDDQDLDKAHDVFEKYSNKIENKERIEWREFENELKEKFNIGYQTVKRVINAFYKNDQWTEVCYEYAKAFKCLEFHWLIEDYEENLTRFSRGTR